MHVSANNQIGRIPPNLARAYGARVKTGSQSMSFPFDVSESSGTVGKINRQDFPADAKKVPPSAKPAIEVLPLFAKIAPSECCGRPLDTNKLSSGDSIPAGNGMYSEARGVGGDWDKAQADFDAYFKNTKPGTVIDFAGGKLTMGNDGIARYEGPDYGGNWSRSTSQFSAGDDMAGIARNNQDIRNFWGEKYGLGVKAPGNRGWYMPFRANLNNPSKVPWGTTPETGSTSGYSAYGLPEQTPQLHTVRV